MRKWSQSVSAMGSFTDFNVWNRDLTEAEMKDFTNCLKEMKGDLIEWNIDDWMFTEDIDEIEYTTEEINLDSMCKFKVCCENSSNATASKTALQLLRMFSFSKTGEQLMTA